MFAVMVATVVGLSLATLAFADRRTGERLPNGVTVDGIAVGGLTPERAIARVWSERRAAAMSPVRVRAAGRTFTLSAEKAELRYRVPDAISRVQARSRKGSFVERGWRALVGKSLDHRESLTPSISGRRIGAFVTEIAEAVERRPVDAKMDIAVETGATVTPGRAGRRLAGRAFLEQRIRATLLGERRARTLSAKVTDVAPAVTTEQLDAATQTVVTVSRSQRRARVFRGDDLVKSYDVAVGQPGYPTPLGRFTVQTMQKNPVWNVPDSDWAGELRGKTIPAGDPRNALVARWIGFDGAVGFHGTKSVDSIGSAASRGCVRMKRADVIDLYRRVEFGTTVLVGP